MCRIFVKVSALLYLEGYDDDEVRISKNTITNCHSQSRQDAVSVYS